MTLDPEIAELVELTLASRAQTEPAAAAEIDVAASRAGYDEEARRWCDPGPEVASVADRTIRGRTV